MLAALLDNLTFQIVAIIILSAAIIAAIAFHVYNLWKEADAKHPHSKAQQKPQSTSVEVHQEFALEVDKEHPLAIKIPVCTIKVDKNAQADNALKVDFCDKDITNPLTITNKKGEVTGKIWTILITNGRGETVGFVQPVIIEKCNGNDTAGIRPLKVDISNNDEAHHQTMRINNKRDEAVAFIKPLVIEDNKGSLVGSAELPTIVNDDGEIIGIARPIVVIDENGVVAGTLSPKVNIEDGKPVQSVIFTSDDGEITIPMHSITVDDVKDIDRATLPEIFIADADSSGEIPIKNILADGYTEDGEALLNAKGKHTTLVFDHSPTNKNKEAGDSLGAQAGIENVNKDDIEEISTVNKETGEVTIVRYNKSFTAKLIQLSDEAKGWYGRLKNEMLSYNRVWNRTGWSSDNINMCENCIAKFAIVNNTICLYFAADPGKFGRKMHVKHVGKARYKNTPWELKIENNSDVEAAIQLYAMAAKKLGLERSETRNVNYYLMYEPTSVLLEKDLMREISRKTIKQTNQAIKAS